MCGHFSELPSSFLWTQFCRTVNLWTCWHLLRLTKGKNLHLSAITCVLTKPLSVLSGWKGREQCACPKYMVQEKSMFCHTAKKGYNVLNRDLTTLSASCLGSWESFVNAHVWESGRRCARWGGITPLIRQDIDLLFCRSSPLASRFAVNCSQRPQEATATETQILIFKLLLLQTPACCTCMPQ